MQGKARATDAAAAKVPPSGAAMTWAGLAVEAEELSAAAAGRGGDGGPSTSAAAFAPGKKAHKVLEHTLFFWQSTLYSTQASASGESAMHIHACNGQRRHRWAGTV